MVQNTFPFITSYRIIVSAWKILQDIFGIDFDACMSKGDSYKDQPYFEKFCEHSCVKYFEETYEVFDEFSIEGGYINEGEGFNVVPSLIDDVNVVVPYFVCDDFFLEEVHNVTKHVDYHLEGDNAYVDVLLMEDKVNVNAYFNKIMQDVFISSCYLNKINPSICSIYDEVDVVEDSHQRDKYHVVVPPKGEKDEIYLIEEALVRRSLYENDAYYEDDQIIVEYVACCEDNQDEVGEEYFMEEQDQNFFEGDSYNESTPNME